MSSSGVSCCTACRTAFTASAITGFSAIVTAEKLALCRQLLAIAAAAPLDNGDEVGPPRVRSFDTCPYCGGRMEVLDPLLRSRPANPSTWHDSS